jgi:hypothetical protein
VLVVDEEDLPTEVRVRALELESPSTFSLEQQDSCNAFYPIVTNE